MDYRVASNSRSTHLGLEISLPHERAGTLGFPGQEMMRSEMKGYGKWKGYSYDSFNF
jgi:hypothetical protein